MSDEINDEQKNESQSPEEPLYDVLIPPGSPAFGYF